MEHLRVMNNEPNPIELLDHGVLLTAVRYASCGCWRQS
jgi:hypothetical protein